MLDADGTAEVTPTPRPAQNARRVIWKSFDRDIRHLRRRLSRVLDIRLTREHGTIVIQSLARAHPPLGHGPILEYAELDRGSAVEGVARSLRPAPGVARDHE